MKKALIFILSITMLCANNIIDKFIKAARSQIGVTTMYDPSYAKIAYPMGDIDKKRGVCTDVVIRALRKVGIDLQKEIFLDKKAHPNRYKNLYYPNRVDPNIDHRRVKNIQAYFKAKGYQVKDKKFLPGDIVVWKLPNNLDHIGICSNHFNAQKEPLIIHNIGYGVEEEDILKKFKIVDHFRIFSSKTIKNSP